MDTKTDEEKLRIIDTYSKMPWLEVIQMADAYNDAVEALSEVTHGAPLSTTIGSLIRTRALCLDSTFCSVCGALGHSNRWKHDASGNAV